MTDLDALDGRSRPRLPDFVRVQFDQARKRWVLQGPERLLVLDETAKDILDRATGEARVDDIVAALAAEFDAPEDVIRHDVMAVFRLLAEKNFLELTDDRD